MISEPSEIGSRAEAAVAAALVSAGKRVYAPLFSAHTRVDLLFEDDAGFHRVQCKTSRLQGDVLLFSTCSNTRNVRKDYQGEAEVFGVYSPELARVFLVPVGDVPSRLASLRLGRARNGQEKGVRWARDYALTSGHVELMFEE